MAILSPAFTFDLESNMRLIAENAYNQLLAKNWYGAVTKEIPLRNKRERFTWFLDSAGIDYTGDRFGTTVEFEELATASTEFFYQAATKGYRINRNQFEDLDGNGVQAATEWARQQGALFAYWPQLQISNAIKLGSTAGNTSFDGVTFFNTAHPNHIFDSSAGTYPNWFHGASSGSYPGALPIDDSVDLDVAVSNLSKAITAIANIPTANGLFPRNLRVRKMIVPSALVTRATLVTDAKFIAGAASGGGGGSFDLSAVISRWGIEVVEAPELGAAFGGSDTTYYLACEQITGSELGALVYGVRHPFRIIYNDGVTDAQLQINNGLQWVTRGENVAAYGMPYLLHRVDAS